MDKRDYQVWILGQTLREFGYVGMFLVAAGFVISFRQLKPALSIALLLLYLCSTSVLILMLGFEFNEFRQAIFRPYPVVGYKIGRWSNVLIQEIENPVASPSTSSGSP